MTNATIIGPQTHSAADDPFISGLHLAFDGFAKTLVTKVNAVIAQQLAQQPSSGAVITQKVADEMPALLEEAFIVDFLQDEASARRRRAILTHLLSAAELQSVTHTPVPVAVAAQELTSEAAAKLLHVSRSHLNTLVDAGQLGEVRRTPGGHRRIAKAAVLQYKAASRERQTQGLSAMVEASERLGLYEEELAGLPVRAKR
jgi:excisionase family DNA binding protein